MNQPLCPLIIFHIIIPLRYAVASSTWLWDGTLDHSSLLQLQLPAATGSCSKSFFRFSRMPPFEWRQPVSLATWSPIQIMPLYLLYRLYWVLWMLLYKALFFSFTGQYSEHTSFHIVFFIIGLKMFLFILHAFNNKSIQEVHVGTQVYMSNIQWTIGLGGTTSHYTRTL